MLANTDRSIEISKHSSKGQDKSQKNHVEANARSRLTIASARGVEEYFSNVRLLFRILTKENQNLGIF